MDAVVISAGTEVVLKLRYTHQQCAAYIESYGNTPNSTFTRGEERAPSFQITGMVHSNTAVGCFSGDPVASQWQQGVRQGVDRAVDWNKSESVISIRKHTAGITLSLPPPTQEARGECVDIHLSSVLSCDVELYVRDPRAVPHYFLFD